MRQGAAAGTDIYGRAYGRALKMPDGRTAWDWLEQYPELKASVYKPYNDAPAPIEEPNSNE